VRIIRLAILGLCVAGLLGMSGPASAQVPGVPASGGAESASADETLDALTGRLTPAQIDAQLAGLTDEEIRELFRLQLRRAGGEEDAVDRLTIAEAFQERLEHLGQNWNNLGQTLPTMPQALHDAYDEWTLDGSAKLWRIALFGAIWFAIGCVVEWLFRRATGNVRRQLKEASTSGVAAMVGRIGILGLIDVLAIGAFALGALGGSSSFATSWRRLASWGAMEPGLRCS